MSRKFDVTDQQLQELAQYHESNALTQLEKLVLGLVNATTRTPTDVGEVLFKELRKRFQQRAIG